jgi:hypothetical protein
MSRVKSITYDELIAIYGASNPVTDNNVLEGINDINWSELTHAYGSAADVPAMLRAALSENKAHREVAYDIILSSIEHQGSVYQATQYAVPFLVKMLLHEHTPNKDYVIVALWQIARDCEGVAAGNSEDHAQRQVYKEIRKGLNSYIPFLEHPNPDVRYGIVNLLCCLLEDREQILPILNRHFQKETDEEARENITRNLKYYKDKYHFS